jgi:hypothetical protein
VSFKYDWFIISDFFSPLISLFYFDKYTIVLIVIGISDLIFLVLIFLFLLFFISDKALFVFNLTLGF